MGKKLPLKEISIEELFLGGEKCIYEVPIYQRNYAWEKDEIETLVQDIYDAFERDQRKPYFIGTLVSYHKGDKVFEVIDGQQRLTTIWLLLSALEIKPTSRLTYRARKKSDDTLRALTQLKNDDNEKDIGIENGFRFAKAAVSEIDQNKLDAFISYFKTKVHIIHYQVPRNIDLNHYFEIMNSRGEQLEKHEIVKATLLEKLRNADERSLFNKIWECCSEMSVYTQQNFKGIRSEKVFGNSLSEFLPENYNYLLEIYHTDHLPVVGEVQNEESISIANIIDSEDSGIWTRVDEEEEINDSFQPIIDFPNFLLIVLKVLRMKESTFLPTDFVLDDKELLNEFRKAEMTEENVRKFGYTLFKARFLLDNFIVHHSKEEDTLDSNPWKLQVWFKDNDNKKGYLKNLSDDRSLQEKLTLLLSMFEVSFTARQRKNYLFYCLLYLLDKRTSDINVNEYAAFLDTLADSYFHNVYLEEDKLNAINTPVPGSFDEMILDGKCVTNIVNRKKIDSFGKVFGDGSIKSKGVPLFVFNYMDYKLWKLYDLHLRGERQKEGSKERTNFFAQLGCSDFGQKVFDQFYFSRTRRSLEHYYPQAAATGIDGCLNQDQINCFGNYAMIGSEANSSGSNWSPKTKLDHYLDSSGKISQISVASLKFLIMMQMCRDNERWDNEEISIHQRNMVGVLFSDLI